MKKLLLALLLLLAGPAFAQTKFRLFDQVTAKGIGLTPAKGQLFYTSDASGTITPLAIAGTGYCLVVDSSGVPAWSNVCTGVVSSVGLSAPAQFTVSGSPVTSSGTLALAWQTTSAHYALLGPTSGTGTPTFRALTPGDLTMTTKGDIVTTPDGVALARLGVGTDGWVLTADSASTNGIKWAAVGAGSVTSVGLSLPGEFSVSGSPVTTSGTLTGTWANEAANKFFVGPATGAATTPTFRVLDYRDLGMTTKGDLVTYDTGTAPYRLAAGTDGYVLSADSTSSGGLKWIAVSGTGTVTSVDMSVPSGFSISGNPITAAGTLALGLSSQTASKVLISPTSGGVPAFRALVGIDLPVFVASGGSHAPGAVPDPGSSAGSTRFLREDATWATTPGGGSVTSVDMSVPSGFAISGNPITTSGTLALSYATGQIQHGFLAAPSGSTGALSIRTIVGSDLPLNTVSSAGAVTTAPNDAAKFWRGDATWAAPAFVSSVALTAPAELTVSGSPVTTSGTLGLGWATETANHVFAGPTTGAPNVPAFRALVAADLPVFVASGASHAKGAVPDPGASAGTTRFLREDATWVTPTFSSSIEVKSDSGTPDVTGVSVMAFDHTTLSVTDNTGGQVTVGCPGCTGTGSFASWQDQFTGDSSTTTFTLSHTPVTNGIIWVALNGLPQPTTAFTISGSNVIMGSAPITGALLAVGYYTALASSATLLQEDFTGAGATDFTLTHTPVASGVIWVSLRGLMQPTSSWSLVAGTTLRMAASVPSGDKVSIGYLY